MIAFFLAVIALLGSLYILDQAGYIHLSPGPAPRADSLWEATFLISSSVDRTTSGENILDNGHTISYTLTDPNMDGLGDVNLDVRVINMNSGADTDRWAFRADLTFVSTTAAGGGAPGAQPIVNRTDVNTRYAISWSLTESGSPTLQQIGEYAVSNDWTTGKSDQLNMDLEMSPIATDDISPSVPGKLEFLVGGIKLTCNLLESA